MDKILPIYYSEYGRYISRFRSIPFYIDCLIPVQRRILLSVYEQARDKFAKSSKVVGYATGTYHPHGDQSAYNTLVSLVTQQYVDKQGNWGSRGLDDAKPAAFRYTECKLSKWVKNLAFQYIDYVPWDEYEYENEPLYLPSPLPLGLIGHGIYTGIAFHRPQVPKYTISNLAKRLTDIINNAEEKTIISPNVLDCSVIDQNNTEFKNILENGSGRIMIVPNGEIKKKSIRIYGRAPNASFNKLINACKSDKTKQKDINAHLVDYSKKNINVEVIPDKKNINLNNLAQKIWNDYLIKNYNINILLCDQNGLIDTYSVDNILINNYYAWVYAVYKKNIEDAYKLFQKKKEQTAIQIIRNIIQQHNVKDLNSIISYYQQYSTQTSVVLEKYDMDNDNWIAYNENISNKDIEKVYAKKSIKALVEIDIDLQQIDNDINAQKKKVNNTKQDCFKHLQTYI